MNILSKINAFAKTRPAELINESEQQYRNEINRLVDKVLENNDYKIILLAGPSGSGKTTSAHIIKDTLAEKNVSAEVISLDNFYMTADKMPRLSNGNPDFESVYSLDLAEIQRCFSELISNDKTKIPIFDFTKGSRIEQMHEIDIHNHGIIIVEGLHALNPVLTEHLPLKNLLKVYISVNCSVCDEEGYEILSSRKMRLARRMSRDYLYRNTTAQATLKLWTSVIEGEAKYLYCFKDTADISLKTFHSYEPCVFKDIIIDLTEGLNPECENYDYVMSLRYGLEKFESVSQEFVPENSLIREFIYGGKYENCK